MNTAGSIDQALHGRRLIVELFATGNLAFLALDVYIAHLANHLEHPSEWIPVGFSAVAPLLLLPGLIRRRLDGSWATVAGLVIGGLSILVGVTGLVLHLQSAFFVSRTLKNLVYTAPFIAPLSYAGVGLLLLLGRLERTDAEAYSRWVTLLAFGGFFGNFGLTLADHAINGFFHWTEWIGVFAAALASSVLLMVWRWPTDGSLLVAAAVTMVGQIVVGIAGFWLHARSLPAGAWLRLEMLSHGAPPFAPLLFVDLAVLALIGLHGLAAGRVRAPLAARRALGHSAP